ncbi:MAG: RidA family protein [Deltaproteobacteria bacterium]|nr:RidA family protein [Deltaproteobacteria bacterium]
MATTLINPPDLATPRGFSHGAIGTGRTLFIAGQTGTDKDGKIVSDDLVAQFDQALSGVVRVVQAAGGKPEDIVKINLLVVNKREYRERGRDIGTAYRKHLGRHFPAMTLAEVKGLFEDDAKVEIEAVAMVP